MTPFTRVVRGVWTPDENEIIKASVTSKLCFLVGLAFVMIDAKFSDLVSHLVRKEYLGRIQGFITYKYVIYSFDYFSPFLIRCIYQQLEYLFWLS